MVIVDILFLYAVTLFSAWGKGVFSVVETKSRFQIHCFFSVYIMLDINHLFLTQYGHCFCKFYSNICILLFH